jgi:hypothetical protein
MLKWKIVDKTEKKLEEAMENSKQGGLRKTQKESIDLGMRARNYDRTHPGRRQPC